MSSMCLGRSPLIIDKEKAKDWKERKQKKENRKKKKRPKAKNKFGEETKMKALVGYRIIGREG